MISEAMRKRNYLALILAVLTGLSLILATASAQQPVQAPTQLRSIRGIENAAALENFFRALAVTKAGRRIEPVRVVHYGDSHTAADILTAEIRKSFQRDFGDGGPGLMVPRNPMSTPRRGVLSGATSGWTVDGIKGGSMDGVYGMVGISLSTSRADERAWLETTCNHFEVYFLKQPGGGSIDITINGASVLDQPISLQSDAITPDYYTFDAPADRQQRIEIRTLDPGKVRIFGIVSEHIAPGVSYDVLGINGARAKRLVTWYETAFLDNLVQRKPDLIILAYGTNEVTDDDWTIESYQRMLAGIIRKLKRAAPQASVLVFGPPDRALSGENGWESVSKLSALIQAQRQAAIQEGAAFWNAYGAMGGAGSMAQWVGQGLGQGDHVHLTSAGYVRLGGMFYEDMMTSYRQSLARPRRSTGNRRN